MILGDTRFSDALVHTLVPTYDLVSQDIEVFDSIESASDAENRHADAACGARSHRGADVL